MSALSEALRAQRPNFDRSALDASGILIWDIETRPAVLRVETYDLKMRNPYLRWQDIETPGGMVSWAAKWFHEPGKVYYSDVNDPHMLERLADLLDRASFDVTYNGGDARGTGGGFDHRKVRGYMATRGIPRPRPSKSIDLIRTVRTLGFESNSLGYACKMFATPHQKLVEIGAGHWRGVLAGDPATIKRHRRYGTHDVRCTEDLLMALLPIIPNMPHMGFAAKDDLLRCPRCGSADHMPAGTVQAVVQRFNQHRCNSCTGLFRSVFHSRVGTSRTV